MNLTVSLIVSTRNRAPHLRQFLESLTQLDKDSLYEIIIVDNNSTDGTPLVLEEFAASSDLPVKIVRETRTGLSRGRNAGIANATGDILAFTDDDCYPAADLMSVWKKIFQDDQIGYAGGRILLFDPTDAPVTIQTRTDPAFIRKYSFHIPGSLFGANMAIRRSALEQAGNFAITLGAGTGARSGDDDEMFQRLSSHGFNAMYAPEAVVLHHHRRKPGPDIDQLYETYDVGRGGVYAAAILDHPFSYRAWVRIFRHVGACIVRRRFPLLRREWQGAMHYWHARKSV